MRLRIIRFNIPDSPEYPSTRSSHNASDHALPLAGQDLVRI
jgi:hypothetical protein